MGSAANDQAMSFTPLLRNQYATLASCLALAMATLPAASAHPWPIRTADRYQPVADSWSDGDWVSSNSVIEPITAQQWAQRCNTGRLVGGLVGGGVGYGMSRKGGRAWAVPLGALLGSQMGCNAAVGRSPLPW